MSKPAKDGLLSPHQCTRSRWVTDDKNASPLQCTHHSIPCKALYSLQATGASSITHDQHAITLGRGQASISFLPAKEVTELKHGDPPVSLLYFITYDGAGETMPHALFCTSSLGNIEECFEQPQLFVPPSSFFSISGTLNVFFLEKIRYKHDFSLKHV